MTNTAVSRSAVRRQATVIAVFLAALAFVYVVLVLTPQGQWLDSGAFGALGILGVPFGSESEAIRWGGVFLLAAGAIAAWISAVVRRRWRDALTAALVVAISTLSCEALKVVLPRPALGVIGYDDNTFPSGHMALAFSAALAIAITDPLPRWRRQVVACAFGLTIVVGWASTISFAHRPSDVMGAGLVVAVVMSAVSLDRPPDSVPRPLRTALAWCVLLSAALIAVGRPLSVVAAPPGDALEAMGWLVLCAAPVVAVVFFAPAARPAEQWSRGAPWTRD
ncbi:phosphatase PAP2 family protein [Rathayibacter sp. KR2-224]|uniref:phosphatase PAP2 family protein n=1 Tax=Rathayibacter sp. KR2-224 TaxID=3400913 RepID=UPI003C0DF4C4